MVGETRSRSTSIHDKFHDLKQIVMIIAMEICGTVSDAVSSSLCSSLSCCVYLSIFFAKSQNYFYNYFGTNTSAQRRAYYLTG